ncbi:MAG: sugar transferase [Alphaproteobacteria bacterium]|nr:sugar transferase [Alphaproteobacteria bacterium]
MSWRKRALDLAIVIPVLLFVAPLLLGIYLVIRMQDGGQALFRQTRYGQGGRTFTCYKFRTMVKDAEERLNHLLETDPEVAAEWQRDQKLRNDPRITPFGRFLRKSSLDELPQLFNILRGEMSIVGPRPITASEVPKYGRYFAYYAATRPGITGLWQVSGRNHRTYDERVRLDARYVMNWSLRRDIAILLRTIPAVLFSKGAY